MRTVSACLSLVAASCLCALATVAQEGTTETLVVRGRPQALRLYGSRGGAPVVVSSGDGGWIHLGPHVAEVLAARGYFVVGFDVRAYLGGFTYDTTALRPEDEPGDYKVLVDFAARGGTRKPVLVGVSEGAGLSVLAATDPRTKSVIAGVIGLGLPDVNELGWRWRDAIIYLTHGVPNEPAFSTATLVDKVAPLPLAAIHSTQDEFVTLAEVQRVLFFAKDPKRLWVVKASDHRFSDNLAEFDRRLLEAIAWVTEHAASK
jgi:pimeloyl-ACP methyl ester carboxylesterase